MVKYKTLRRKRSLSAVYDWMTQIVEIVSALFLEKGLEIHYDTK